MKRPVDKIVSGAFTLGTGAFIAKVLGAIYRVPLTNLLGCEGLGLYQMIFPVYSVLLDFSGAGVPSALSKMIAGENAVNKREKAHQYLTTSIKLLCMFGVACALFMLLGCLPLSRLQGNQKAWLGYVFLSPSVFLVAVISCYRGYFQGFMNMRPTAISQIVEQVVKLCVGLMLVKILSNFIEWAVAGATFAITMSEAIALLYLVCVYKRSVKDVQSFAVLNKVQTVALWKRIIKTVVPITLIGVIIPLSQIIDSCLIINLLGEYREDATALYGILSGVVATVIGLPVSVCYGVSSVAIPAVSGEKEDRQRNRKAVKTILLTLCVALPCAILCYIFANFIVNVLFGRLSVQEKSVAVGLLKASSPCVVLLSLLQTTNAVLIGKNRLYLPVLSMCVGVVVKEVLNVILLKNVLLNVYGGAIAIIACYFTVCLINFIMIFKSKVKYGNKDLNGGQNAG